jgi:hypothetical protein
VGSQNDPAAYVFREVLLEDASVNDLDREKLAHLQPPFVDCVSVVLRFSRYICLHNDCFNLLQVLSHGGLGPGCIFPLDGGNDPPVTG